MHYHIHNWVLNDEFSEFEIAHEKLHEKVILPNLSKINIFVGANNSGKSRLLRKLACNTQVQFTPHFDSTKSLNEFNHQDELKSKFLNEIHDLLRNNDVAEIGATIKISSLEKGTLQFLIEEVQTKVLEGLLLEIQRMPDLSLTWHYSQIFHGNRHEIEKLILQSVGQIVERYKAIINSTTRELKEKYKFNRIYVPIMRGLRTFKGVPNEDIFHQKTVEDYFANHAHNSRIVIYSGLRFFNEIHDLLTGTYNERNSVGDFEKFLSESFFSGKRVTLIPSKSGVLNVKIGDEKEFPIHNLGDGIQSIIVLTFPLFKHKGESLLVFYEEPEQCMHPGMQRIFLDCLNKFPENQYFLTTHSNHFLDITLDLPSLSIFSFRKKFEEGEHQEKAAKIIVENVGGESRACLQLLGVNNSSVLLTNCTIWVEGITDRRYVRKFFELYQSSLPNFEKRFKEDVHFSFVEYGGANITHWSFLEENLDPINVERLCGKLFLITDRDTNDGKKAERFEILKEKLDDRYFLLPCREIENILTPKIIKNVVESYFNAAIKFPPLDHIDYSEVQLAKLIDEKLSSCSPPVPPRFAGKYGNLTQKVKFGEKAIGFMTNDMDLSEKARELCKKLYAFIKDSNQ